MEVTSKQVAVSIQPKSKILNLTLNLLFKTIKVFVKDS